MIRVLGAPDFVFNPDSKSEVAVVTAPLGVDFVDNARVPVNLSSTRGWQAGVYDCLGNVCQASLIDRARGPVTIPFEASEIAARQYQHIGGEMVYGGMLFHHYGHFLLESTCRLWWLLANDFKGPILFQNEDAGRAVPAFAHRFFDLLGLGARVILATQPISCDRMIVPHRSFVIQKQVHANFLVPFIAAGDAAENHAAALPQAAGSGAKGVYLSRSRLPARRALGEERIERMFEANDFAVVHMQELSLEQQILVVRRHAAVAGVAGAAMHNVLFSRGGQHVTYIFRGCYMNSNNVLIDKIMNNEAAYIHQWPQDAPVESWVYSDDTPLDVDRVLRLLREGGIVKSFRH